MDILHAHTDPDLLTRLKEMLGSANRADIAVGYFFMSGFEAVAGELSSLEQDPYPGRSHRPAHIGGRRRQPPTGQTSAGTSERGTNCPSPPAPGSCHRRRNKHIRRYRIHGTDRREPGRRGTAPGPGDLRPPGGPGLPPRVPPRQGLPLLVRQPRRTRRQP